ncbi:Crp/Fnr family transcriptional regulator [Marivita sp.]|uniref:Crp/Fnr family transcriptional regulator n=1 Tax=Marivita sp. TaxID=2003365 RepID=UPI0025C0FF10|nr:Crp/Fnr family transcriptional regulator [Marivita sp.]
MTVHPSIKLPRTGLLRHAPVRVLEGLDRLAVPVALEAEAILFEQGDDGDALFALDAGTLEVSVQSADGRKLTLDVVQPGNLIGEIALFDPGVRTATVMALEPCRLLSVSRGDLIPAILGDPQLGLDITALAARRMRLLTEQLHQQAFLRLPERLARKILHLTSQQDDIGELTIGQEELADFSGASREAVSKTLSKWRQFGVIEIRRQKIIILDRDKLRSLGGADII